MANTRARNRRTRAHRGGSSRAGGSGLIDTVRSTITQIAGGSRGRTTRGGRAGRGGGGLASQASGFVSGLLGGSRGGRRRR